MPSLPFATFLIVCPTSFFLGILFSLFPYDYPLLWSSVPTPSSHYDILETHLKLLYNAPHLVVRIFHIVIALGLGGILIKLYKPTESNMLFDGGSLVLYMVAVIVYVTNVVAGLRMVNVGIYGVGVDMTDQEGYKPEEAVVGREDNLKVLSATNTILALVLVGVLVLQAGQWYAERTEERERRKIRELEAKEKAEKAGDSTSVRRQTSGRESKKSK